MVTNILVAFLFSVGVYFVFSQIFEVPSISSVRSVLSINRNIKTSKGAFIYSLSQNFVGFIKLNDFTKEKVEDALKTIGDSTSAEMYYTMSFVRLGIKAVIAGMIILLKPVFGTFVVLIGMGFFVYGAMEMFSAMQLPDKLIRQRRKNIEAELPRFVAIITQELKNNHNVVDIIEYYERYADPALQDELRETLAGMHSGNAEMALLRLESRVGSDQLSEVVRGLVRALSGDDPLGYFEMISNDFRALEISHLKKESLRRPQKINKYSFFILMQVVKTIFLVLCLYAADLMPSFGM